MFVLIADSPCGIHAYLQRWKPLLYVHNIYTHIYVYHEANLFVVIIDIPCGIHVYISA